ncbi:hypothetical protein JW960_28655 [candidate division KSB1 bacterium]|nr:hypothetical protein [candidate division KSB1 bacterium]
MADIRNKIGKEKCAELLNASLEIADEIREIVLAKIISGFEVQVKSDNTVVTDVDMEVESLFRQRIHEKYPDHGIIGEEFAVENKDADFQWLIDPIDGTEEFIHHIPTYGTIIGLNYKDSPIVGMMDHPTLNARIYGAYKAGAFYNDKKILMSENKTAELLAGRERIFVPPFASFLKWSDEGNLFDRVVRSFPNIRIFHGCYAYTLAITGGAAAMVEYNVKIWDLAASQILAEEAGGAFQLIQRQPRPNGIVSYGAVFGRKEIVEKLVKLFPEMNA